MDDFSLENPLNHVQSRRARLVPVDSTEPRYAELEKLFRKGWKHPGRQQPHLHAIYKLISPQASIQPYLEYKSSLVRPSLFKKSSRANEDLLFHGTTRACLLGESSHHVILCDLPDCCLCAIIRGSFDIRCCGRKNKFSRFGAGIYTSACSSKADDYVSNLSKDAVWRVLLLNRVAVGRSKQLRINAVNLTGPPPGYDSVVGVPGADLNYEETVVYANNAIRPSYLVVYGGEQQVIKKKFEVTLRKLFTTPLA